MEEYTHQITVKEALTMTMNSLSNLVVPIAFIDSLGIPIRNACNTIQECISAIKEPEVKQEEVSSEAVEEESNAGS